MFKMYVENGIDYSTSFVASDAFTAVMCAIGHLLGPCRSGEALFYKM